ncbi:MAG TPA: aldo/keto reductase [Candidatus Ozemobacteraceae bacterium]|nr:aldo/keto reductase [Candidatus Ozemobacteraceae bacterium]
MQKNFLGKTGIAITHLGIGTLTMSPMQRGLNVADGALVILHALASGINFIDTAQMYGSYPQVGEALRQWKGAAPVVASKSAARTRETMQAAVGECLQQTGLKKVDAFLLHAVRDAEDFAGRQGALDYLLEAKKAGLIGAVGASSHSAKTIDMLGQHPAIDVLHPMYNRDGIGILDASLDDMTVFLNRARANGKGIYAMKPLGGGQLRNDAAASLDWVLRSGVVDAAVVGMTSADEVDMNVQVATGVSVDPSFARKVAGQPRRLFINAMVCINCGACIRSCQQSALKPGEKTPQIDHQLCVLCGYCSPVCPKFAIRII